MTIMPDYTPDFFTDERDPGYYKVTYGGDPAPAGPFEDVPTMAAALNLTDYPGDGYIVTWEPVTGELGSVPSLNPDDLVHGTYRYLVTVTAPSADEADTVVGARLGHDEDYGFDYAIDFSPMPPPPTETSPA